MNFTFNIAKLRSNIIYSFSSASVEFMKDNLFTAKNEKPKKKTRLQRLKELGLLGAIKDSEITSENYKKHLKDSFDKPSK